MEISSNLTKTTSKNHISALNILVTAAFIKIIFIVKLYQICVLLKEHKKTCLNLYQNVPLRWFQFSQSFIFVQHIETWTLAALQKQWISNEWEQRVADMTSLEFCSWNGDTAALIHLLMALRYAWTWLASTHSVKLDQKHYLNAINYCQKTTVLLLAKKKQKT